MKLKRIATPSVILICVVLALVSFFAYNIVFFNFSTDASGYTMTTAENTPTEGNESPLWFTYDNNQIILNTAETQDASLVKIYALSIDGVTAMTAENMAIMNPDYIGSFIAALPEKTEDINDDGTSETVYAAAKTDMEFTHGY